MFDSRLIKEDTVSDDYGIDWDGPVASKDTSDSTVNLDDVECPLTEEQFAKMRINLHERGQETATNCSPLEGVRAFQIVKNFTNSVLKL